MNDEPDLFANLPPVKSPRLLWMEKHGIRTNILASSTGQRWIAETSGSNAYGQTERDALIELALKLNLKLWNQ